MAVTVTIESLGRRADESAAETEALRRLPDELAGDLRATGLPRAFVPTELGGPEVAIAEVVDGIERLAWFDGATAWCGMISATTSILAGWLPPGWAETIYGPEDAHTGGFAAPVGTARHVDGGLAVTGRWQWGSGIHHCTWIGGGTRIVGPNGEPAALADGTAAPFVFLDPADVEILDTWRVSGLKGTGSTDYRTEAAFVPEGRWTSVGGPARLDRTLYRFSFFGALAVGVAAVGLGLARRAVDELVALGAKRPQGSSKTLAERPVVQADLAAADASRRAARLLLDDAVAAAWADAESGRAEPAVRLGLRQAATTAMIRSAEVVDACYTAGGGAAVYETSPLQRVFRDVHVATQHAMVAPRVLEVVGRAAFGLPVDLGQI